VGDCDVINETMEKICVCVCVCVCMLTVSHQWGSNPVNRSSDTRDNPLQMGDWQQKNARVLIKPCILATCFQPPVLRVFVSCNTIRINDTILQI
jgi:hypothetical protein